MPAPRRRRIGHRRRVEDEGDDDGGLDALDLDDDSLSDGSGLTDDDDAGDDSDTSNVEDDALPAVTNPRKSAGNGAAKSGGRPAHANRHPTKALADTQMMLQGLAITDSTEPIDEMHFDDLASTASPKLPPDAPLIVSSASVSRPSQDTAGDRRRREHEEYKRRRDEDPSFVPNRGAFFMHDHRHAGPAGNGFRPFPRQGRVGRGGYGGPFASYGHLQQQQQPPHHPADPTVSGQWAHDMHDTVAEPNRSRPPRRVHGDDGFPSGTSRIPVCPSNPTPINRTLSTEKHIWNAQVRVFFPPLKEPIIVRGLQVKQYTKLPDHRPPLRRDKPVRISLPNHPPRFIFPATDRSFIFIPRAMRPNQKPGLRGGKTTKSVLGSVGGWSRRTSVIGSYYGSTYSPSIAARSRRSSIAPDSRDYMFSPTGSVVSRAAIPPDPTRPIVRLPPTGNLPPPEMDVHLPIMERAVSESLISNFPPPQTHPLPQKPTFQENRPNAIPMHQPRPQKAVSVADIESPTLTQYPQPQQPYQQAFHQQVPVQMVNGGPPDSHARHPSFQSQHSIGTPLSQIPERAIHAAPFQPNGYPQQPYYNQPYPVMQPQSGYYYPPHPYSGGNVPPQSAVAPTFVPGSQQPQPAGFPPQNPQDTSQVGQGNGQGQNLIAQEVNGMVYYYDPSQLQPVNPYQGYSAPQGYGPGVVGMGGMGGMVTPNSEGYFQYHQAAPGMVYYPQ
jgi:hypothetical protein